MNVAREAPVGSERQDGELASESERTVARVWREVMERSELPGLDDDFFALGGDSMTMVLVEFRITEELGVQLPGGTMLAAPTVRLLAAMIDQESRRAVPQPE